MSTLKKDCRLSSEHELAYFLDVVNEEKWESAASLFYEVFISGAVDWMNRRLESEKKSGKSFFDGKKVVGILSFFEKYKEIYRYKQPKSLNACNYKPEDVKKNTVILFEGIIRSLLTKASFTWDCEDKEKLSLLRTIFPHQKEDVSETKDIPNENAEPTGYQGLEGLLTIKQYNSIDLLLTKLDSAVAENRLRKEESNERSKSQEATTSTTKPTITDSKNFSKETILAAAKNRKAQETQAVTTQPSSEKWGTWGEDYDATTITAELKEGKFLMKQVETHKQKIQVTQPTLPSTSMFSSTESPKLNSNVVSGLSNTSAPSSSTSIFWLEMMGTFAGIGLLVTGAGFFCKRLSEKRKIHEDRCSPSDIEKRMALNTKMEGDKVSSATPLMRSN